MRVKALLAVIGILAGVIVLRWAVSKEERNSLKEPTKEQAALSTRESIQGAAGTPELLFRTPSTKHAATRTPKDAPNLDTSTQAVSPTLPIFEITPEVQAVNTPRPTAPLDPSLEALRELEARDKSFNDKIVPGLGGADARKPAEVLVTPTIDPTATPTGLPLVGGQARGYAMLYLMHPMARQTVERQLQILLEANVQDVYLGVLTDGTFTDNIEFLASVVRRIGRAGRTLTLALYLTNGATMRSFATTTIDAGFNRIDPLVFRKLIQEDFATQQQFLSLTRKVAPVFELNRRENRKNRNIAHVMLEDNLNADAYRAMRSLAVSALPRNVQLIRNPCPGCYRGNDTVSFGDGLESHRPEELLQGAPMTGFSLDGVGYALPGDPPSPALNQEQMHSLLSAAVERQLLYFGLWRGPRQGITTPLVHPDERIYEVPNDEQRAVEIDLLRFGLTPLKETDSNQ